MHMKRQLTRNLAVAAVMAMALSACGGGETAGEPDAEPAQATEEEGNGGAGDEDLVAAAEEEGEVSYVTGGHTQEQLELLKELFEAKYDIELVFNRQDTGTAIQMVEADRSAGVVNSDVVSLNDEMTFVRWSEEEVIEDPGEVPNRDNIPEVLDAPGNAYLPFAVIPMGLAYNSSMMEGVDLPASWEDVLAPEYDNFIHANPSASGAALAFVEVMTRLMGEEWYQGLSDKSVAVVDSALALNQSLATGEQDWAMPGIESAVATAQAAGEPIEMIYPDEGVPMVISQMAVLSDGPNPNAGRLLLHFQLSQEYQEALAEIGSRPVLDNAALPESMVPLEDLNLIPPDIDRMNEEREQIVEIFDEAVG